LGNGEQKGLGQDEGRYEREVRHRSGEESSPKNYGGKGTKWRPAKNNGMLCKN